MTIGTGRPHDRARRTLTTLLLIALAAAVVSLVTPWLTGRTVVNLGPWRVTLQDPFRPIVLGLASLGLLGLTTRWERLRPWRPASWICLAGAAALVAAMSLRGLPEPFAAGDLAVAELYVLHTVRTVWPLGPYSQFYWHHPGPAMFQLLAPLYAAADHHPAALSLGAALINVAALAGAMRLAAQRLPVLVLAGLSLTILVWLVRTGALLTSFWNPHLLALPVLLCFWLAVAVAAGRAPLMPALAAVAAFVVQTHVGTTPVVATLAIVAIGLAWRSSRLEPASRSAWWRAVNASAWVSAFLWALPLAEELTARPGNLTRLAAWFWEHRGDGQPLLVALGVWGRALHGALLPGFAHPVGWALPGESNPLAAIVALIQAGALAAIAWRGRGSSWATACGLAAAAEVVALLSVVRMPGQVQDHAVFWIGILGTIGWGLLIGLVAMRAAPSIDRASARREPLVRTTLTTATISVALLLAAGAFMRVLADVGPPSAGAQQIRELTIATVEGLDRHRAATPLVRIGDDAWSDAAGTLLQLYKRGVPFAVERESLHMFGAPLGADDCGQSHVLRFVTAGGRGDGEVIARAGPVEARLEARPACATGP